MAKPEAQLSLINTTVRMCQNMNSIPEPQALRRARPLFMYVPFPSYYFPSSPSSSIGVVRSPARGRVERGGCSRGLRLAPGDFSAAAAFYFVCGSHAPPAELDGQKDACDRFGVFAFLIAGLRHLDLLAAALP